MVNEASRRKQRGIRIPNPERERERENAPRGGEYALLLRERLIDLDDGFVPARSGEFFDTEKAREEATAIAQLLTLDNLKIGDGGIENGEATHDGRLNSLAVS